MTARAPMHISMRGESGQPSRNGYIIANEKGSTDILGAYSKKDIVLTLPGGRTLKKIKWLSVWCDEFDVNFGELNFPARFNYPSLMGSMMSHQIKLLLWMPRHFSSQTSRMTDR